MIQKHRLALRPNQRHHRDELLKEALFRAQTKDAIDRVGCAVGGGEEVAHLKFAEETNTHHLDSGKDEDASDDEDGAVKFHDVLTGDDFENEEPRC